jgi:sugar phosphate isomerase/epimerase
MAKIPVGMQLFSMRGECAKDLPATLEGLAKIGYEGVEPWGYGGEAVEWQGRSAGDLRRLLDDNGLKCCGIHLATGALQGDNLKRTVELNQALGNRFLIVAADKQRMSSKDGIRELGHILEEAADAVKPHGMYTGYHAHGFDFETIDGQTAWDTLFGSTRDDIVMQIDIGNCAGGGGDPIGILRKFPNRARSVHLKDYGGGPDSVIGEGKADWPEIFRLCETIQNPEWYVVEEGGEGGLGFDIPRRSLEALHRMGK